MDMNKKAILFSLMAIGLSSLFLILFSSIFYEPINTNAEAINTRIKSLDKSINDFYQFTEEAMPVAGKNALIALYNEINQSTLNFLPRGTFRQRFSECATNSTRCQNKYSLESLLNNYSTALRRANNAEYTFKINNFSIIDEASFAFRLRANVTLTVKDPLASWNLTRIILTTMSMEGAPDPLWLNINRNYYRVILINDIQDTYFNNQTLLKFIQKGEYRSSTNGSCLSDRYENNTNGRGGSCGIESIVDIKKQGLTPNNAVPHIDYQLVNGRSYNCTNGGDPVMNFTKPLEFLRLKQSDATRYNIEGLIDECQD